jgi:hypothetical protein
MRFYVADTLTGKLVGRLYPHDYELADPWTGVGTGTIKVALPAADDVPALVEATLPRKRWVAVADESGYFVWSGPITGRPGRSEGEVVIPVADWRTWFYAAYLRPGTGGSRGDVIVKNTEQATIARTLALAALDTPGAPAMVVDGFAATGVKRDRTCLQLDRSVGDYLDGLSARKTSEGIEWWVYTAADPADPTRLVPHVGWGWPERRSRASAVRLEWRLGSGGNLSQPSWPTGDLQPTRVWAVGEGNPPAQPYAVDEDLDIADGGEVAWETLLGPLDGVVKSSTCFDYSAAALDYYQGRSGQFEADVTDEAVPVGDYTTGDRARLVYDDGWDAVDLAAVRITKRVISKSPDRPLVARVTLDLANDGFGDTGEAPGESVTDEGG